MESVNATTFVELVNSGRNTQVESFGTWFSSKQDGKQLLDDLKARRDKVQKHLELMNKYIGVLNAEDLDTAIKRREVLNLFSGIKDTAKRDQLIREYTDAIAANS